MGALNKDLINFFVFCRELRQNALGLVLIAPLLFCLRLLLLVLSFF